MAKTSALGSIVAKRQSALGTAADPSTDDADNPRIFFRYLSAPTVTPEQTNNRFREGGGGRDVTLSLKEGIAHNVEFPLFARPTPMGYLMAALTGPNAPAAGGAAPVGGGSMSNGLVRPPKIHGTSPGNTTLDGPHASGATILNVVSNTDFSDGDQIVIGWGANMEFLVLTTATTMTVPATLYPHANGEPVYTVAAFGILQSDYDASVDILNLEIGSTDPGFSADDVVAVVGIGTAAALGTESGQAEEGTLENPTHYADPELVLTGALTHDHGAGAWVYAVDTGVTATRIHLFEPMTALDAALNYHTVEANRAAGQVIERVQDCKLGTFEFSGEAPQALRAQINFMGRFGKVRASAITEDYVWQDVVDDLPFRMVNGNHVIQIADPAAGGDIIGMSTKMRQFTWNMSNILAEDIWTDSIARDELLDLARESNFGAQFYYENNDEYMAVYYGDKDAAEGTEPTTVATGAKFLLDFSISAALRMNIYCHQSVVESWPVEVDPEPKPIVVESALVPLKASGIPLYICAVQNKETGLY
jgi:hypothetical protein